MAIINPGFESGLTGWAADDNPFFLVVSSNWDHESDPDEAYEGSGFLRWTGDTTQIDGGGGIAYVRYFHSGKVINAPGNTQMHAHIYARARKSLTAEGGVTQVGMGAVPYSAEGEPLGESKQSGITVITAGDDTGWQKLDLILAPNQPEIAYYKIFVHVASRAGATVDFDALEYRTDIVEYVPAPVVPPPPTTLVNPGFETGTLAGWQVVASNNKPLATVTVMSDSGYVAAGAYAVKIAHAGSGPQGAQLVNEYTPLIKPGSRVGVTARVRSQYNVKGNAFAWVGLKFLYADGRETLSQSRMLATNEMRGGFTTLALSLTAPVGAIAAKVVLIAEVDGGNRNVYFDSVDMTVEAFGDDAISIISPTTGTTYEATSIIPLRVTTASGLPVESVIYTVTNLLTMDSEEFTSTSVPWSYNINSLETGNYSVRATAILGTFASVSSALVRFSVGEPVPPTVREYKASNSYTYLIGENFIGLGGAMPPTARVLGVEVLVDYTIDVLVRSKDVGIADPAQANYDVAFAVVDGGTVEAVLLNNDGTAYTQLGAPMSNTLPINRSDFTVTEDGTSEGMRWTALEGVQQQVVIGAEDQRFGLTPEFGSTFINYGVGLRFTPNLATVPSYADAGDASYRFKVHSFKVRVYFDAGSVEYYFASLDKTQVLKGTLTAYYVYTGNFRTNDASGVLQLTSELEQMDGTQRWIGSDWTIHSSYPPTDNNQIGEVDEIAEGSLLGMQYNGLPTQQQVLDNRSRYEFKTENFYGSTELNSMYGVHGLPRAFAYNGDFFYKIYTQADAEKDSPRHVANHHGHLALGFYGGRVDISVAGEPYNFSGVDGASSWAFGDKVVGLLPLSGTILGVFGAKSVWGISGTTVDNFATQVISPNMGAVEYTITDMGFPVYANAYGIYTLNQIQQYGDYLGQPMSQDISPWLRPRLIRKLTSDKEVVCAFPVRSKNQYRLCFSDGYVTSMTLNGRQVPTFSFQKYFYTPEDVDVLPLDLFSYPSIVPAAVSSELDESGEERIHMAPVDSYIPPAPAPAELESEIGVAPYYYEGGI